MRLLLDTNAYLALLRGDERVAACVRRAERLIVPAVVLGELEAGFRGGHRYEKNRRELSEFLANPFVSVLPVTETTAERFGRIIASLRRRGTPIPTNDAWVAAAALESGADLLSFDRHFAWVDGVAWRDAAAET